MKRTRYIIIHAIQTVIYVLLAIIMTIIKPANEHDKIFIAFYGFLVVMSLVCIIVLIIALCTRGDDDDE